MSATDKPGADSKTGPDTDLEQPFISHLVELRQRLVYMVFAVLAVFIVAFPFANDIYTYLADPLMKHLPEGTSMIATDVASPFLTPFKLTLVLAIFVSMPWVLYQLWGFIAPGLYANERRLVLPLVASSTILYYLGMAFAYYVVFPLMFGFFVSVAPDGVAVMTDISKYLDFVLKLFFAFGVAFEVPVATVLLVITGMTTPDKLAEKRPYMIVGVFVLAMLLTPPDVISQTLLAVPVLALFELGILAARFVTRNKVDEYADPEPDPGSPGGPAGPSGPAGPTGGNKPQPGTAQPGVAHPGAAEAAAAGLAALNAPIDADASTANANDMARDMASEEQLQADADAQQGAQQGEHPDEEDEDGWEEGDDELDAAIAEEDALNEAAEHAQHGGQTMEAEPGIDWDDIPGRFTDEGLDEELDLMDGDLDDSPVTTKAEQPSQSVQTESAATASSNAATTPQETGDSASNASAAAPDTGSDTGSDNGSTTGTATRDASELFTILASNTEPDPDNPGLTIPRSFGVWQLPAKAAGKRYRFGHYPARGKDLEREFGKVKLVKLFTARNAAKTHADQLN